MSLYPSLEDMKVHELQKAQMRNMNPAPATTAPSNALPYPVQSSSMYPTLTDYMGLNITQAQQQIVSNYGSTAVAPVSSSNRQLVQPVTGGDLGIIRSEIKQGLRKVLLCKDGKGRIGIRVQSASKGIFIAFVHENSPASMAGLRFGDQVLEINDQVVAGWTYDRCMKFLNKCSPEKISMVLRDRPFERTITMNKDSSGHIGFLFKDGRIGQLVKDSSAARNGLLIDHQLIEVNGQNVVGIKDKMVREIMERVPTTVTVTVMPCFVYDHIVKTLGGSLKKLMDHNIPDI